jgi:hypothetical protein
MSWHFSRALVEAFSEATCSDGEPSAPSSGSPTPQAYCSPDRMTACSRLSRFGMTCSLLTDDRGEELLTWYRAGFPVRTSASPERAQVSTASGPGCGRTWHASLATFDPVTSSWRTVQRSLLGDSDECSVIWPRSGMTADGRCWELPMSGRRISATDCGLWLGTPTATMTVRSEAFQRPGMTPAEFVRMWSTPNAVDGLQGGTTQGNRKSPNLSIAVKQFPTPQASDNRNRGNADTPAIARRIAAGKQVMLTMTVSGGQLNPTWVEWLMGWPLGWTDLKPLAMVKYQQWRQQHGGC